MYYNMAVNKKPSEAKSEDIVGCNNGFYWLLDGATPPDEKRNKELTQEYLAALNSSISQYALECEQTDVLLEKSIKRVKDIFEKKYTINREQYLPYSTAVVFKIDKEIEYSVLGDSYLSIILGDSVFTITDDRLKNIAVKERKIVRDMRENGVDEKSVEYIQARKALINMELNYQNKETGYWVAGFNPRAAKEAISGKFTFDNNTKFMVLAASDGLARLVTHFGVYKDFNELSKGISCLGAANIFNMLRDLEADKSNFIKPLSSKNDDASYVLVTNN